MQYILPNKISVSELVPVIHGHQYSKITANSWFIGTSMAQVTKLGNTGTPGSNSHPRTS